MGEKKGSCLGKGARECNKSLKGAADGIGGGKFAK